LPNRFRLESEDGKEPDIPMWARIELNLPRNPAPLTQKRGRGLGGPLVPQSLAVMSAFIADKLGSETCAKAAPSKFSSGYVGALYRIKISKNHVLHSVLEIHYYPHY
jgi:hypothetical protein